MPNFLQDTPTDGNSLGGPHEKLSETLGNIINNLSDSGSVKNIIGLFGDWGSGKSSIIKKLNEKEGSDEEKYKILEFDSWSHKDEFLKRAFLIELTKKIEFENKSLGDIGFENEKVKAISTIDYLSRKNLVKTLDIKPKTKFAGLGLLGALILFLTLFKIIGIDIFSFISSWMIPVLSLKVGDGLKSIYFQYNDIVNSLLLIVIGIIFYYGFYSPFFKTKEKSDLKTLIDYFLFKKVDYSETITSSENEDFSNYDYQEYFTVVVKKFLLDEENKDKKLIIVLDNLDRVNDDIVLNSISLIQTTIEGIKKETDIFNNLIFILPIDKKRLKEVFEKLIKTVDSNNGINKDNFTEGFIDKTFSVIVDIPKLEQSNWRMFFKDKLKEAFCNNNENENVCFGNLAIDQDIINELIAKFYSFTRDANKEITPREIINFINELVSNYIYWGDRIPFKKQGEYILYKRYKNINDEKMRKQVEKNHKEAIIKQIYKTEDIYNILYLNKFIGAVKENDEKEAKKIWDIIESDTNRKTLLQNTFDDILGEGNDDVDIKILGNMCNILFSMDNIPNNYKEKLKLWLNDQDGYDAEFVSKLDSNASKGILKIMENYTDMKHTGNKLPKSIMEAIILSNEQDKDE